MQKSAYEKNVTMKWQMITVITALTKALYEECYAMDKNMHNYSRPQFHVLKALTEKRFNQHCPTIT